MPAFFNSVASGIDLSCLATKGIRINVTTTQRQNTTSNGGA
ncbi:hypothetical protein PSYMO_28381 [Pseudomonas amygdali pv. mori str. 301020]|uniref:Uncharacterized protein n=1 Tax=Pseudomonas amygdali pv. mori str. 301020 TaxID=629261 RepID=A0A656GHR5_PSEA0|nr:hypothetical protein PSYMO_28381 [Pseudomonas amygdali pv. mori str. 301020]